MSDLPKGWIIQSINSVFDVVKDKGQEGVIPYLEIGNVDIQFKKYILTDKPSVKGCKKAQKGDVLVSKVRPTRGAITQVNENQLNISSAFTILRNNNIADKYLWLYLAWNKEFLDYLGNNCTGTMYPTTPDEVVSTFTIPIAPLNEQKRIVEKLEKLLGKVEAAQARLDKIPAILKRFRQAVLAAACSGKLTTDWRAKNNQNEDWKYERLEDVCENIVDCPHSTPRWANSGIICIRTTNFKPNFLDLSEVRYVSEETYQERTQRLVPKANDIVYSREGGILGIACIIPENVQLALGQRMMLMRTKKSYLPRLLMYWLNSPEILEKVRDLTGGSAAPHLNVRDIKSFQVPVTTIEEQNEIVRRVEDFFKFSDQIEARYKRARSYTDKLTQSILAKAFRGELVPQDETDESASVLLERIKAEKSEKDLDESKNTSRKKAVNQSRLFD